MTTPDRSHVDIAASAASEEWSLFLAGDCVIPSRERHARPFGELLTERIRRAERSFVNLEGPITDDPAPLPKSGPLKHSAPDTPEILAGAGFEGVALANNHAMDRGEPGLMQTIRACSDAGIAAIGAGRSIEAALEPAVQSIGDVDVAVLNLCEREFGSAGTDRPGTAWFGHPAVERRIETATATADVVVVIAHGGVEYVPLPPLHLQERFRALIDKGVDLVVGHHPHVPQGWERYRGGAIFYSLGNFYFEQPERPKTSWGLALEATFSGSVLSDVELIVTELHDGVVEIEKQLRGDRLDHLHHLAEISADREALKAHWQELAVRIFHQRYTDRLTTGVGTNIFQLARNPARLLELDGHWDADERESELLLLLNLFRNESHRSVIQTALEVETGDVPDLRTRDIEETVDELLSWTEDRAVTDRPPRLRRGVDSLFARQASDETSSGPS